MFLWYNLGMTPEPGKENPYKQFQVGGPSELVGMGDQRANLPVVEDRSTPYKVAKLPDPIPGTTFGSDRQRLDEQRKLGNISESVLVVTNPVDLQNKDNDDKDFDLYRMLMMGGRGATNLTADFGDSLKKFAEKGEGRELEKVKVLYSEMLNESMGAIFDMFEKNVKSDEKNAYPYDYRKAEFMQDNIKQAITSLERLPEIKNSKEAQVFIIELKQDAMWLDAMIHTTVSQSASLPYKFDVLLQMQLLKEGRYCAFTTNDDMEALMSLEIDGVKLTAEQRQLKAEKKIGIAISEEYTKLLNESGEVVAGKPLVEGSVGLREIAVKMFASSFKLRMNLAAASQVDFEAPIPEITTFKGQHLTKAELKFYKELFWDRNQGQFLTPYVTSKGDTVREYTTLLEAAVIKNAHFRIKEIINRPNTLAFGEAQKNQMINDLTREIKAEALSRRDSWRTRQDKDMVSMLATIITQQGLLQDFSYGHSYNYCWAFQWDTDPVSGNPVSRKAVEMGGIYSLSGDFPSLDWARRKHTYDGMGNSCTKFLLPTSSHGRAEVSMYPLFKMPGYTSFVEQPQRDGTVRIIEAEVPQEILDIGDTFLEEQWKFLFSNEKKYVDERKEMGYESLHPDVARQLKKWAFKWKTPWTANNLENVKDRDTSAKYELEIPHLMPSSLGNISNFWDSISLGDKLNFGGESVFQQLINGKETYEIDWKKCETQAQSRWKVDLDMASRYMKVLIEPVDAEKDPILGLLHAGPSTFALKELAKRLRLSMRDSDEAPSTVHEIALIPFMVVMTCAEKHGLGGPYAWIKNTDEDKKLGTCNADRFFNEMAYWKRAMKWLPGDRAPKDKFDATLLKYGNEIALLAEFYEALISRAMKSSSEESFALAKGNLLNTGNRINKLEYLNKGGFPYSINTNKALQK